MIKDDKNFLEELSSIVKSEDEGALRKFVTDHIDEFGEDDRDAIMMALLEEALEQRAEYESEKVEAQKMAMDQLGELGKARDILKKKKDILDAAGEQK